MGRARNQRTAGGGVLLQKGLTFSYTAWLLGQSREPGQTLAHTIDGGQEFFLARCKAVTQRVLKTAPNG